MISILIVLIPFYAGVYRLFTARLEIGRERVQARAWSEAVAALEPFDLATQRFLDRSGEAHYLLAQAYAGVGDKARAEKARVFVRRRKGVWAENWAAGKARREKARRLFSLRAGKSSLARRKESQPRRRF